MPADEGNPSGNNRHVANGEISYGWAYATDMPGSRCDPDDEGVWPRSYQLLGEDEIWAELNGLARPQRATYPSVPNSKEQDSRTTLIDSLNFQPCLRARTQDRYIVRQLNVHGQLWTLTGVFDGHLGETTVDHVAYHLPVIIGDFLRDAFSPTSTRATPSSPSFISDLLRSSILAFDNAIANDVLSLFPGGLDSLGDVSDAHIQRVINDQHAGGVNYKKARLCMYGTTALIALVDPQGENMWVANVGDCQAILATEDQTHDNWTVEVLTRDHNGDNDAEVERVRREHPGEPECVVDRRVLGAIAPFRCLGDVPFKQPPEFSRRILYNILPGFHDKAPWEEFLVRNLTPPYISANAEVVWRSLTETSAALGSNDATAVPSIEDLHMDTETNAMESYRVVDDTDDRKRMRRVSTASTIGSIASTISSGFFARAVGLLTHFTNYGAYGNDSADNGDIPPRPLLGSQDSHSTTSSESAGSLTASDSTGTTHSSSSSADSDGSHVSVSVTSLSDSTDLPRANRRYLILASDGFTDLCCNGSGYGRRGVERVVKRWARGLPSPGDIPSALNFKPTPTASSNAKHHFSSPSTTTSPSPSAPIPIPFNTTTTTNSASTIVSPSHHRRQNSILTASNNGAVRLLREAVGGNDRYKVSKVLTLDMDEAWVDDTVLVVASV